MLSVPDLFKRNFDCLNVNDSCYVPLEEFSVRSYVTNNNNEQYNENVKLVMFLILLGTDFALTF